MVEVEKQTYVVKFKVQNVCDMLRAVSERFEPTFAQNGVEFVTEYPDLKVSFTPCKVIFHDVKRTFHGVKRISHGVKRTFHAVKYNLYSLSGKICIADIKTFDQA